MSLNLVFIEWILSRIMISERIMAPASLSKKCLDFDRICGLRQHRGSSSILLLQGNCFPAEGRSKTARRWGPYLGQEVFLPSHSNQPEISPSQHVTCDVAAGCVAVTTGFARHPPTRAHLSSPTACQMPWPYRVHFPLGLVVRLVQLPTEHRCSAVAFGYPSVARP